MSTLNPPADGSALGAGRSPLIDVDALRARLGDPSLRIIDARFELANADAGRRARLGDPSLRIIDARFELADPGAGRRAFAAARIPGAVYAHLDDDLSDHAKPASEGRHPLPDADAFAATLARWRITPSTPVVVYDGGSGAMAAARAWWLLRWMGHTDARVLDGGFAAWTAAGAPVDAAPLAAATSDNVERRGHAVAASNVDGAGARHDARADGWHPGTAPTVDADAAAARDASLVLIDARARERFRGEVEPLDPKAGHIPRARNRPFADNVTAGRFKSAAQLRHEWSALLPEGTTPLLSCGSGVTACHNALALVQAGWPMPVLFAPSWSGWVSDPSRPVATGD